MLSAGGMGALQQESNFGALYGEQHRCPHCQALAQAQPDAALRWKCGVCGGPRVPQGVALGEEGMLALRGAHAAKGSAQVLRFVSWTLGLAAAATFAVAALAAFASPIAGGVVVAVAVALAVASARASRSASSARKRVVAGVEHAWENAIAEYVQHAPTSVTAAQVASALNMSDAQAEASLTTLAVHDRTRVDVGDDAQVRYGATTAQEIPQEISEGESEEQALRRHGES